MRNNVFIPLLAGAALGLVIPTGAAVLTMVPMQGPMVHASLLYNATQSRLEAHVESVVPQLTPLDVSNPGDSFAPSDPWYPILGPSQLGMAFNRQYGFVVDASSDPLPNGVGIWIRKLTATPGLGTYRYRSTDPKAWEPIFGQAGSTNVWQWNLAMFHPAIAAPPAAGTHSATFEAFAVNLVTGQPEPGIGTAEFTLDWTVVPSSRPQVSLGLKAVITWPVEATNCLLQCADDALSTNWTTMTNPPVIVDGQNTVILDYSAQKQFFRLLQTR